jgi:thiol:disulfide interchange protein
MFFRKTIKSVAIALACLSIVLAPVANTVGAEAKSAGALVWEHDVDKGKEQAKKDNKCLLVDLYTDWCTYCKKMDKVTFTDAKLQEYLADHCICLKANAEDKGAGQKLAESNGVTDFPSYLVFAPQGKLLGRIRGFRTADAFQKEVDGLLQKAQ